MSERLTPVGSWGRPPRSAARTIPLRDAKRPLNFERIPEALVLPYGNGRSYGDCCLNDGGALLQCRPLSRILSFDASRGVLRAEAGILLSEILERIVPAGFFLPVAPGTQQVTLGGAIANDIHGKNHQHAGTIGCHVRAFELLRSDGSRRVCSADGDPDSFAATIGGLGLTGLIVWAEISLKKAPGVWLDVETIRFDGLEEFTDLCRESDASHEYTVAWIDGIAGGRRAGRGCFSRAVHRDGAPPSHFAPRNAPLRVPVRPPFSLVRPALMRAFNALYYHRHRATRRGMQPFERFFFPLDVIRDWNRLYGRRGFFQHQFVVPTDAIGVLDAALAAARSEQGGAALAVAKMFGSHRSPGLLSFPRPGATLAMDLADRGASTRRLLARLDRMVAEAGGRAYPAKDANMSAEMFRRFFPEWESFAPHVDPRFSSGFWRRVTGRA